MVGPGWSDLVEQADQIAIRYGARVQRVEDKLGTLSFEVSMYASMNDDLREELLSKLDNLSKQSNTLCALCGKPGTLHYLVWTYKTLCKEHLKRWLSTYEKRKTRYNP